ncbi:hypothetical protein [Sphingomonas sp.]|uniref:ABC transporter substrate-binding protein n=1 Tax=Sphingomonas sp. TaxID=28214 RepID=UPI00286DBA8B|nr:hypothetical protein [Sphingomonas sp.]
MSAFALLLAVSSARIASLNLCTDEYLLLLARPGEVASVSYLAQDRRESPLWQRAKPHHVNHGSIEQVLVTRPSLVLTMGGGGRASKLIAGRMRIGSLALAPASSLDDVAANLRRVAGALGAPQRANQWLARLAVLRRASPRTGHDTIWLSGSGDSLVPGGAGAQWLRLAGLEQRAVGDKVGLETLLIDPPKVLVHSDYRLGQVSRGARWLDHPVVRRAKARRIVTDGRPWTCMGPLMIPEIERLRALAR